MVYRYVFYDDVYYIHNDGHLMGEHRGLCYKLSLLFASRQLYRETASLPYKLAVFHLGTHHYRRLILCDIRAFLRRRSYAQINAMARVKCHVDDGMDLDWTHDTQTGALWVTDLRLPLLSRPSG